MLPRIQTAILAVLALLCCIQTAFADDQWLTYTDAQGETVYLKNDRAPALYTGNFGDCLGGSLINVTRFDGAYYQDNMTVLFHLAGTSAIQNESLMMYIGVYAYGESRFDLTFNPCQANIASLCPLNGSHPIEASGIIPVNSEDVGGIPSIAFSIPDFEGEAILRIFANSTQSEIGCYSAVLTNGNTFAHPEAVGSILGIFTFIALIASFATAAFGQAVPTMRLHYAHSMSVGVVFAVFQHIFFTGALSVNWPSVLVAFWRNYAWAGGMIYSSTMQDSINALIGNNVGNTSQVGAASAGSNQDGIGGGYDISQIYKRAISTSGKAFSKHPLVRDIASEIYRSPSDIPLKRDIVQHKVQHALAARALPNTTSGFSYYGSPVKEGLPLPGNYSGFAGTLAQEDIRTSNAFMTGFLWFLILLVLLVAALVAFKWALEGLARFKVIKEDRLKFFREHWLHYTGALALRTCVIAFFMMIFLTTFQFTYESSGGVKAVAAIVFGLFMIGIPWLVVSALLCKKHIDTREERAQDFRVERKTLLGKIPWFSMRRVKPESHNERGVPESKSSGKRFWQRASSNGSIEVVHGAVHSIHDNEEYTMKYGWLAARFRRSRWWCFAAFILYELVRAVFYGGASGHPLTQVFGLLVVEFIAAVFLLWARPFEGQRLNIIVVYCLGFSKLASVGLSASFNTQFNLERITATAIGIVIIVIQGILTIITMIAIIIGAISSYMSVSRNHEDFRPKKWAGMREKYFNHLDRVVNDVPREPKPKPVKVVETETEKEPYFEMRGMRRLGKIEDDDAEFATEMTTQGPDASVVSLDQSRAMSPDRARSGTASPVGRSRATSMQSMNRPVSMQTQTPTRAPSMHSINQSSLPYGARAHRPSWSTKDFAENYGTNAFIPVDMTQHLPEDNYNDEEATTGPAKLSRSRRSSRVASWHSSKVRPSASTDDLKIGRPVSTADSIGPVPAPAVRPRAGTIGSLRGSRTFTPTWGESTDSLGMGMDSQPASKRGSRHPLLTPAQEQEEWLPPMPTRD